MVKSKYITIPEFAKLLGVSRIAVYKQVKSGQIKATRIGKNYVISDSDIVDILGESLTEEKKRRVDEVLRKALREYGELLGMLGKPD